MSSIVQSLLGQLSGRAIESIAKQLGVSPAVAHGAVATALPLIVKGLSHNTAQSGGATSLFSALDRNHDGSVLDDIMGFVGGGHQAAGGAAILGHLFGGGQDTVAQGLGQSTGLGAGASTKLLSLLAPLVLGQLGREKQSAGLDAAGLAGALMTEQQSLEEHAPSAMDALSGLLAAARSGTATTGAPRTAGAPDLMAMGASLLGQFFKPR